METDIIGIIAAIFASGVFLAFAIGSYVIQAITIYKLAEKADAENRWLAFIPGLQVILFLNIIGKSGWLILLFLIPVVNFFFGILVLARVLQAFGMPLWVVICSILIPMFFQITLIYMAFSNDVRYTRETAYI